VRNARIILSSEEEQILNGSLLGDGSLYLNNRYKSKSRSACFKYASSQGEHVEFVWGILKNLITTEKYKNGPIRIDQFDKRTQKTYVRNIFITQSNITFFEWYQKWYLKGKKIVPYSLNLTPLTCLLWYIGDGNLDKRSQHIRLCTNGFDENHVDFLVQELNDLTFESYKQRYYDQYVIVIPRKKVKQFLHYIGPCPIVCYQYKWDYRDYLENRYGRKQVLQYDLSGNLIRHWDSLRQIRKELGFFGTYISDCCSGKYKKAYNFKWKFAEII
jgi:hypothetical protein